MNNKISKFLSLLMKKYGGYTSKFINNLTLELGGRIFELNKKIGKIDTELTEEKVQEIEKELLEGDINSDIDKYIKKNYIIYGFLPTEKKIIFLYKFLQLVFDLTFENEDKTEALLILKKTYENILKEVKYVPENITYQKIKESSKGIKLTKFKQFRDFNTTQLKNTIAIGGRYGVGKTIFAINFIEDVMKNNSDAKVLYFGTQEVDTVAFIKRMMVEMSKENVNGLFYRLGLLEENLEQLNEIIRILKSQNNSKIKETLFNELTFLNILNINEELKELLETYDILVEKKKKILEHGQKGNLNKIKLRKINSEIGSIKYKIKENLNWFKNYLLDKKMIYSLLLELINKDDFNKNKEEIGKLILKIKGFYDKENNSILTNKNEIDSNKIEDENKKYYKLFPKEKILKIIGDNKTDSDNFIDDFEDFDVYENEEFLEEVTKNVEINEEGLKNNLVKTEKKEIENEIKLILQEVNRLQEEYSNEEIKGGYENYYISDDNLLDFLELTIKLILILDKNLVGFTKIEEKLDNVVKIKEKIELEKNKIDLILEEEFQKVKMFIESNGIELYNNLDINFIEKKIKEAYEKYNGKKKLVFIWDYHQSIYPGKTMAEYELSLFVGEKALDLASRYNALGVIMTQLNDVFKKNKEKSTSISFRPSQAEIRGGEGIAHKVGTVAMIYNRDMGNINDLELSPEIDLNFVIYEIYLTKNRYGADKYKATRRYYVLDKKKMRYMPISEAVYDILDQDKEIIYLDQLKQILRDSKHISESKLDSIIFSN